MDIQLIITRLKLQPAFKRVGGAIDLPTAQADLKNLVPAVYVIPLRESAGQNLVDTNLTLRQAVRLRMAVMVAVSNVRDVRGEAAQGDLEPVRAALRSALLGWTPDPAVCDPFEFDSGRLVSLSNATLWWLDIFRTVQYVSNV